MGIQIVSEPRVWTLGHVYDVTEYFNNLVQTDKIIGLKDKDGKCVYEHGYFLCHDVWDTHIYRIQVGINAEYEDEPRTKIIETENIRHGDLLEYCVEKYDLDERLYDFDERSVIELLVAQIGFIELLKSIIELDYDKGFENWDINEFRYDEPLENLVKRIDGGYGITKIDLT